MNYVKTQFGNIHINDLPVVVPQTTDNKVKSSLVFFSVIILLIVIFFHVVKWALNPHKKEKIIVSGFTDKVPITIAATNICVYDANELFLENIVLITSDDNVLDINVLDNAYVKKIKTDCNTVYTLDFQAELNIKEIILISSDDPINYITHVNIDLYNYNTVNDMYGPKVWEYSSFLPGMRENSILISKQVYKPSGWHVQKLSDARTSTEKIIMNENELALTLTETSENYTSY